MFKINGAETAFALASLAFCAIHWLVERSYSIRLVLSALLLGAIAATLATWLSDSVLSLIRATMKPPKDNRPADFDDVDQCLRRPNAVNRIHDASEEEAFSETTLPTMARREPSRSIPLRSPQCATA
jgi:hypothetical protein